MARGSYKMALAVKGIKPIPPYHKLRTAGVGARILGEAPCKDAGDTVMVRGSGEALDRRSAT